MNYLFRHYLGRFSSIYMGMNILCCFVVFSTANAQKISGQITDQVSGEALGFATVFLNNLSKGTSSNEKGQFELPPLSEGKYELVVSYVGYETFVQVIDLKGDVSLKIQLIPKERVLKEIVVTEDKNWKSYYEQFLRDFIGHLPQGERCAITNPDILRIHYEADSSFLQVQSDDMLIIENQYLGYKIKYLLKEYRRYYRNNYVSFYGYMFFEEMSSKRQVQVRKWIANRANAYQGSLQHFLRGVHGRNYEQAGFQVRRMVYQPTDRKPDSVIRQAIKGLVAMKLDLLSDTVQYWVRESRKPMYNVLLIDKLLPADSISYREAGECRLRFTHSLQVRHISASKKADKQPNESEVSLQLPWVAIDPSGLLANPLALTIKGSWIWREKISYLLPFDYALPSSLNKP